MSKTVVIMRGIPGSGKSTFIKNKYPTAVVCSADNFYMKEVDGVMTYCYDTTKTSEAHSWNFGEFVKALKSRAPVIVVDCTNIKPGSYQHYVRIATSFKYDVVVNEILVKTEEQLALCVKRNVHNVPAEIIKKMLDTWQADTVNKVESFDMVVPE